MNVRHFKSGDIYDKDNVFSEEARSTLVSKDEIIKTFEDTAIAMVLDITNVSDLSGYIDNMIKNKNLYEHISLNNKSYVYINDNQERNIQQNLLKIYSTKKKGISVYAVIYEDELAHFSKKYPIFSIAVYTTKDEISIDDFPSETPISRTPFIFEDVNDMFNYIKSYYDPFKSEDYYNDTLISTMDRFIKGKSKICKPSQISIYNVPRYKEVIRKVSNEDNIIRGIEKIKSDGGNIYNIIESKLQCRVSAEIFVAYSNVDDDTQYLHHGTPDTRIYLQYHFLMKNMPENQTLILLRYDNFYIIFSVKGKMDELRLKNEYVTFLKEDAEKELGCDIW
ncbi:hypothetical protein [uncultured Arcobacter sp.]|uniref:hypothetical protein n=1 Tax=uncultured Arcobacter sp. TaxID=165434 RepID=UPI00260B3331|nr:hypothetical protein [uncultured Arcobacter sp.]